MFGLGSHRFRDYRDFNISKFGPAQFVNFRNGTILWIVCDFLTGVISVTVYEIFADRIKRHKFYLENEGTGQEGEKWICAIPCAMIDFILVFFRMLAIGQHTFRQT